MLSKLSLYFTVFILFVSGCVYYPKWKMPHTEATISWDVCGYYWYIPALLIYDDVKQQPWADSIMSTYRPASGQYNTFTHDSGNQVMKYAIGQAISFLPAFVLGHTGAYIFDYDRDGFSLPYQMALFLWGLFISSMGLYMLRKILLLYFDDLSTAITLIIIGLATNFLEYGAITNAMTHNYLFFYYCLLIWSTIHFYKIPTTQRAFIIGALIGIMTLTRPTEILSVLIPLLYNLQMDTCSIIQRFKLWISHRYKLAVAIGTVMLIGIIQPLYWHNVTGQWIVYSYQDQGFSWLSPHIIDGLVSAKAGWWMYTPIMIAILPGSILSLRRQNPYFYGLFLFLLLFIYVTFAWDIWWYGGSLGQRSLIQIYPILAFTLAAFTESITRYRFLQYLWYIIIAVAVHYNFWLTHQAHKGGLLIAGEMTAPYLKATVFKHAVSEETKRLLDVSDYLTSDDIARMSPVFDTSLTVQPLCLGKDQEFTQILSIPLTPKISQARLSFEGHSEGQEWESWRMHQLILKFYDKQNLLSTRMVRPQRIIKTADIQRYFIDCALPKESDKVELILWNPGTQTTFCIHGITIHGT